MSDKTNGRPFPPTPSVRELLSDSEKDATLRHLAERLADPEIASRLLTHWLPTWSRMAVQSGQDMEGNLEHFPSSLMLANKGLFAFSEELKALTAILEAWRVLLEAHQNSSREKGAGSLASEFFQEALEHLLVATNTWRLIISILQEDSFHRLPAQEYHLVEIGAVAHSLTLNRQQRTILLTEARQHLQRVHASQPLLWQAIQLVETRPVALPSGAVAGSDEGPPTEQWFDGVTGIGLKEFFGIYATRHIITESEDLSRARLRGAILSDRFFSGVVLAEADLSHAHLQRSKFRGADLSGANLSYADLTGADLTGANLTNADLREAVLTNTKFRGANLTGALLQGTRLFVADFTHAILTQANLAGALLKETRFSYADLSGAQLGQINLKDAYLLEISKEAASLFSHLTLDELLYLRRQMRAGLIDGGTESPEKSLLGYLEDLFVGNEEELLSLYCGGALECFADALREGDKTHTSPISAMLDQWLTAALQEQEAG